MKGHYRDATVAMDPDPDLFRRVFERLPGAWIEDPAVADHTIGLPERQRDRITWDEPIHNLQLPAGDLPRSPLPPEPHRTGFRWGSYDGRPSVRERLPGLQ